MSKVILLTKFIKIWNLKLKNIPILSSDKQKEISIIEESLNKTNETQFFAHSKLMRVWQIILAKILTNTLDFKKKQHHTYEKKSVQQHGDKFCVLSKLSIGMGMI